MDNDLSSFSRSRDNPAAPCNDIAPIKPARTGPFAFAFSVCAHINAHDVAIVGSINSREGQAVSPRPSKIMKHKHPGAQPFGSRYHASCQGGSVIGAHLDATRRACINHPFVNQYRFSSAMQVYSCCFFIGKGCRAEPDGVGGDPGAAGSPAAPPVAAAAEARKMICQNCGVNVVFAPQFFRTKTAYYIRIK